MRKIKQLMCALLSLVLIISMGGFGKSVIVSAADIDSVTIVYNINDKKRGNVIFERTYQVGEKLEFPRMYDLEYKYNENDEGVNLTRYKFNNRWYNENGEFVESDTVVTEAMDGLVLTAEVFSRKDLKLCYYVLNRGLTKPDEISSYPIKNYSAGIEINDAIRHFVESGDVNEVNSNIIIKPTREQLAEVGVILADNEDVEWYVLKDEADHWHIDGIIVEKETEEEPTEDVTEEITTEEPTEDVTEEITTEESTEDVTEEITTEEPTEDVTEEITTEEPTEDVTEEITTEESTEDVTEEITTEEPTEDVTEEITTEESIEDVTEEPTTEESDKKSEVLGSEEVNNKKDEQQVIAPVKKPAKKGEVLSTIEIKGHINRYNRVDKNSGVLSANTANVVKTNDNKPVKQATAALVLSGTVFVLALRKKQR